MRFDTSQQMRLGQQMKLGPRMIQAMEILQMPMMALQERIEQELEANIALEQVEGGPAEEVSGERDDERRADRLEEHEIKVGDESRNDAEDWERLSVLESSYKEAFDYEAPSRPKPAAGERDRKMDAMANVAARGASLTEQLLRQWTFAEVDAELVRPGEIIIGYVGDDGILEADLETILEQNRNLPDVQLTEELLERSLEAIHDWVEPAGVAARDKKECFLLQIDALSNLGDGHEADWENVRTIIGDHFDDLIQNRLPKIAQTTGLEMEEIQAAIELMKRLNLSPGLDLVDRAVPAIIPDVVIEFDEENDTYVARLASGQYPPLCISSRYAAMAKDRKIEKTTREFVQTNVRSAQWLIDSIQQRQSTLLRVVNVVLARQRDFFDKGPQHLRPLPMIEVADQLGIHVATVSRAVAEKWLQTPRGLVSLRKFFSGGTRAESGRDMSWDAVKAILQEIIDQEDKKKPMSDEALSKALKAKGIDIARRTVVKYRKQLGIPPARQRKVFV